MGALSRMSRSTQRFLDIVAAAAREMQHRSLPGERRLPRSRAGPVVRPVEFSRVSRAVEFSRVSRVIACW
jgi:hypothetical protein